MRRSPRSQQKGRNSRTAYRFSTDHREIRRGNISLGNLSLSVSIFLPVLPFFSFSRSDCLKGSPLLLPFATTACLRGYIPQHIVSLIISTCLLLSRSNTWMQTLAHAQITSGASLICRGLDEFCRQGDTLLTYVVVKVSITNCCFPLSKDTRLLPSQRLKSLY